MCVSMREIGRILCGNNLKEVREAIRVALPEAGERISWRMQTFWEKSITSFILRITSDSLRLYGIRQFYSTTAYFEQIGAEM